MSEQTPIERAVMAAGSQTKLAADLGVTPQAVQQWVEAASVPAKRVLDIERLTGVSRHDLRPDIFGPAPKPDRRKVATT